MLKIGHPMDWENRRTLALIRGEIKGRWWGLEERMRLFKQPWFGICYLTCYFLLEIPLFMICLFGETILHPWDFLMSIYKTEKFLHEERRKMKLEKNLKHREE